jgi:hypothetical protein
MEAIETRRGPPATVPDESDDAPIGTSSSGDLGAEVASLAVEDGETERTTSHEERDAEEQAMAQHDAAQVGAMRDEASSMRTEGLFDAAAGVGEACVKVACPDAVPIADGLAKLGDGVWHAAQHDDEATAAAQKAAADQAQSAAQNDAEAGNDASDYVKAALDFYRGYVATEGQTQSAALHRA